MKLSQLKQIIDLYSNTQPHNDPDVVVIVKLPYQTVGAMPSVEVKSAQMGFDWENGKFLLQTEEPLTPSDRDFEAKFKALQEKYGWLDYENRNLKSENAKLKKKLNP